MFRRKHADIYYVKRGRSFVTQGGEHMIMVTQYTPYPAVRYSPPMGVVAAVSVAARSSPDNEFEERLKRKKNKEVKREVKKRLPDVDTYEHALPEEEDMYAMERAERLLW